MNMCIFVCVCVRMCVRVRCQYSQLEKTRGQECSSIGKLWSCSWHSALMVILEREGNTHRQKYLDNDVQGTENASDSPFSVHEAHGVNAQYSSLLIPHNALSLHHSI